MDISGNYLLPCSRERAWEALNDPDLLKRCLKGCEKLERTADNVFAGTVSTRIGPVSARFAGTMRQSEIVPPASCRMTFEGQGGVAGFARGKADVALMEEGGATRLTYVADTQIGGKLAQMGARLIEGVARSMADDFFGKFAIELSEAPAASPASGTITSDSGHHSNPFHGEQIPPKSPRKPWSLSRDVTIMLALVALAVGWRYFI